jgi:hypothetical protein
VSEHESGATVAFLLAGDQLKADDLGVILDVLESHGTIILKHLLYTRAEASDIFLL